MSTTTDDPPRRSRASRLPPDERRAAIIAATIPLIREHGYAVTTRQIADAAGVAEGTLFRVFEDKDELVRESVCAALQPTGLEQDIAAIRRDLPLRLRLLEAASLLQNQLQDMFELMAAIRLAQPPGDHRNVHERPPGHENVIRELEALVEPDRDIIRLPPKEVARLLRVLAFAGSHVGLTDGSPMTADEIVSVLLDGVQRPQIQEPTHT